MNAELVEDENLPAARRQLEKAVNAFTTPLGQFIEGDYNEIPSPYHQLADAVPGQQGVGGHTNRSMPPVWIDAVKLLGEIDVKVKRWQPAVRADFIGPIRDGWCRLDPNEHPTVTRLHHLTQKGWRPQDADLLNRYSEQITTWILDVENLLNPARRWSLPNSCPACNQAVVYRRDNAGEPVRKPALTITEAGCECLHCHHKWTPEYFQHLANVLNTSRSTMDRNELARLLRETFWKTISDGDNPFWFDTDGNRIDGKIPHTIFDRLADAINDGLREQATRTTQ